MRWTALTAVGLLIASAATAQMGMPGGGGPGGGGMRGGGGQSAPEAPRPSIPRPPKPLSREKFDKAVTAMFRTADANHDGMVTPAELQAVIDARREALIRARFARIDRNRNGSIDLDEFVAWQRSMGSAATSDTDATGGPTYVADNIRPDYGDGPDDRILERLIEPLSATVLVNANVSYHAGITLDELLAYERKRFDAADANHDGEISIDEARGPERPDGDRPGPGGRRPPPQ